VTSTEQIIAILTGAGYREFLPPPISIANLRFEFASALVANKRSLDLVVVVDLVVDKDHARLAQRIQSLARALDLTESRRSLTVIVVNGELDVSAAEYIVKVCRLLSVGVLPDEGAEQYVRDWLAVLLPLPDLDQVAGLADWKSELERQLGNEPRSKLVSALVSASIQGSTSVESTFASRLKAEVRKVLQERSDG
jgi:hypothetical protein